MLEMLKLLYYMLHANHVFCSLQISQKSKVITNIYVIIIIVHNNSLIAAMLINIKKKNTICFCVMSAVSNLLDKGQVRR